MRWIDTHCHLDASEFVGEFAAVREQARVAGVVHCVLPAVTVANFDAVRLLAHQGRDSYCLGLHPLYVPDAPDDALVQLQAHLHAHADDPRLVAVGEIGLDFFVPALTRPDMRACQEQVYREQLRLARRFNLPVVLHVRRSADRLLKHLREVGQGGYRWRGIAHAFNGSLAQAQAFVELGFMLGFGGAVTFERALQLRRLAAALPLDAIVLETDAPDIPPQWLYTSADARAAGAIQGRNAPAQLPRIAAVVAQLRGLSLETLAKATTDNAIQALPKLEALLV